MDRQLKSQLQETVKHQSFSTVGSTYGEPSYSTSVTSVAARVEGGGQLTYEVDGQQIMAAKVVYCAGTSALMSVQDQVWLPGESTDEPPWPIGRVDVFIGERGSTDYYRVLLGSRG